MKVIGITGPTGAGKTTAVRVLETMGGCVIDCDEVYHGLLEHSVSLREELTARFGRDILDKNGRVDRKALGRCVFQDSTALATLNTLTHRYVAEEVGRLLSAAAAEGRRVAAIDAIALIESGLGGQCAAIVGILAPKDVRIHRIMAREGISEEYARLRVEAQREDGFFRANCTHILENSGDDTLDTFAVKTRALFEEIL